ncbi:MAG: indole-3-glycerol phosphate synthase TrpC [Chloroflexi bacterium]|nr:indole-3-glycerol phosphate synthase TrpC [Chloroflexota bacterium]
MTILDEIRAHKEQEVADREARHPLSELIGACGSAAKGQPFAKTLAAAAAADGIALIAEVKRSSPSAGALRPDADATALGSSYVEAGASAVSVLTDERFFSGRDSDLRELRTRVTAPLLRKDFTISSYQIYEARTLGADAVLLIVSMLSDEQISACLDTADSLGLDAIVEVHSEEETRRAVALHVPIIGINNRNLATFQVDLATTEQLRPLIPDGTLVIGESGISTRADVQRLQAAGVHAVLVGSALVTAIDPAAKVRELLGRPSPV